MKSKIMLVFGTRPEAIKMAPLVKEFQKHPDKFDTIVCVTGQHREMLDQVLTIFDIKPDYDLNIMKQGQDLYDVTSRVLLGMRDVLKVALPDVVLVHGDTTTSTAAALAAFYQQIPVGHVEAGLRTHNIYSPWPEEMNRQITGRIASYDFAPTPLSKQNLIEENIAEDKIIVTGNTVIDALYWVVDRIKSDENLSAELAKLLVNAGYDTQRIDNGRKMVLITGHRRENFGEGFISMCKAIKALTEKYPDVDFVYPMHLNPNVRKPIHEVFGEDLTNLGNMFFIEPLEYLSFVYLMEKSNIVLTDSGGIQEEAPGLGKPVLVMRDTTERPEALDAGTVKLVGTNFDKIVYEVSELIEDAAYYEKMSKAVNPYGDGLASKRIIDMLINVKLRGVNYYFDDDQYVAYRSHSKIAISQLRCWHLIQFCYAA
jgi:UDP-N-acetylglucosamine 2-epimerase (non-hydrolysing)